MISTLTHQLITLPLLADAGVPMLFLTWPAMGVLLLPIIVVEGLLCSKWLGLKTWQGIKANAASNTASAIIGIPAAWTAMLVLQFGTLGLGGQGIQKWHSPLADVIFFILNSAWLVPIDKKNIWLIPAATLVLLVPFFFASYWIEYLVVKRMLGVRGDESSNLAYPRIRIAVRNANLVTYGIMVVATSIWVAVLLLRR